MCMWPLLTASRWQQLVNPRRKAWAEGYCNRIAPQGMPTITKSMYMSVQSHMSMQLYIAVTHYIMQNYVGFMCVATK